MDNTRSKLYVEKSDVQKECQEAEKAALKQKLVHVKAKLKLNDVQEEYQETEKAALMQNLVHMEAKLKLNDVQKECQEAEAAALKQNLVHMEAKLKLNDVQKECQEAEAAALKQNLVHMKAKLKLNDVQKECQEAKKAALKQELLHMESKLKLIGESSDNDLDINSLPNEMILKIFGYLEQNQLGQIARVCRRWNILTRNPALWKKVDVKFHCSHKSQITVAKYFVSWLPPCVTIMRLYYTNRDNWTEHLNFEELCLRLQEKCPHLETLILEDAILSNSVPMVIRLCTQFLKDVKTLVFRCSRFVDFPEGSKFGSDSKIEVLNLSGCHLGKFNNLEFSNLPQLRVLNLGKTGIGPRTFQSVRNHGLNLQELYLCGTYVRSEDFIFNESVFPQLQKICIFHTCYVTSEGIVSLIKSCQSLQKLYFGDHAAPVSIQSLEAHPFFVRNRRKFEILKWGCHVISKN